MCMCLSQYECTFSSDQSLSCVWLFVTPRTTACQASLSITSSRSNNYSNSCPSHRWCHPTISSSVVPFSSHFQSFPASGSFPMSRFFSSGGQSTEALASQWQSSQWIFYSLKPKCVFGGRLPCLETRTRGLSPYRRVSKGVWKEFQRLCSH